MRFLLGSLFLIFVSGFANAQALQSGFVKEYNEKSQKTPLSGVELNIRSANTTVSDKDGQFSLQFLTLKPGEKVNVRRIEKMGYEIFNKEAIEQWNINPNTPFVIVMCRSDKFKAIRDNYQRVASENYDKQYKKEQARLAKLKEEGKIKETEYQQQLTELMESYDKQLDDLDNYVDKFSRIDLSELSFVEQEIIELVQQGRFEEAIQKYEEQNYLDKYRQEVADIKEVTTAIDQLSDIKQSKEQTCDSLFAAINRQVEILRLSGGKENFDKIGTILKLTYSADTTKYEAIDKYANYLYETKQFAKSLPLYCTMLNIGRLNGSQRLLVLNRISLIEKDLENFNKALFYLSEAENLVNTSPSDFSSDEKVGVLLNKGLIYRKQHEIDKSKYYFRKAIDLGDSIECSQLIMASVKNSLANVLYNEHHNDDALKLYDEVYSIYKQYDDNTPDSNERLSGVLLNISQIHRNFKDYDESINNVINAIPYITRSYEYNPRKYAEQYINILNSAGNAYSDKSQYDLAESHYMEALRISKLKYDENPYQYWRVYYQPLANLAILHTETKKYEDAIKSFYNVIDIIKEAPESNYKSKNLGEALYNLSYIYCITDSFKKAIPLLEESLVYAESLFAYNKRYGAMMYLNSLNNVAYCYDKTNDYLKAKETYSKGIEIIELLDLSEITPFNSKYANFIYNLGYHIHHKESLYSEAIQQYKRAYNIYENLRSDNDILETAIGLSECYLKLNQIDKSLEWISKVENEQVSNSHIGWLHTRGLIAFAMGEMDIVMQCRNQILAIDPMAPTDQMELFISNE